jgi:Calcineurin-like phosphoesterase
MGGARAAVAASLVSIIALGSPPAAARHPSGPPGVGAPAAADTDVTLYLIGDAGVPHPGFEPVLAALTRELSAPTSAQRVVVFLGDNIYDNGMPAVGDPDRAEAERRITAQMAIARTGAQTMFLPGNHDWDGGRPDGWAAIRREGDFVRAASHDTIAYLPRDGCPGPSVVDVGSSLRLILLDTQWWLQHGPRPGADVCPTATTQTFIDSLHATLAGAGTRRAIVMAHHPLYSGGPHGGRRFIVGLVQRMINSDQDLSNVTYKAMKAAIERAFTPTQPVVYAAGHDHNLQVIGGGATRHYLVSGAGDYNHLDGVRRIDSTHFDRKASGYMRLDVLRGGPIRLGVHVVDASGTVHEVYSEAWP